MKVSKLRKGEFFEWGGSKYEVIVTGGPMVMAELSRDGSSVQFGCNMDVSRIDPVLKWKKKVSRLTGTTYWIAVAANGSEYLALPEFSGRFRSMYRKSKFGKREILSRDHETNEDARSACADHFLKLKKV